MALPRDAARLAELQLHPAGPRPEPQVQRVALHVLVAGDAAFRVAPRAAMAAEQCAVSCCGNQRAVLYFPFESTCRPGALMLVICVYNVYLSTKAYCNRRKPSPRLLTVQAGCILGHEREVSVSGAEVKPR